MKYRRDQKQDRDQEFVSHLHASHNRVKNPLEFSIPPVESEDLLDIESSLRDKPGPQGLIGFKPKKGVSHQLVQRRIYFEHPGIVFPQYTSLLINPGNSISAVNDNGIVFVFGVFLNSPPITRNYAHPISHCLEK